MVGLVVAASTITGVFVKLPAGVWSDLIGRTPLLLTAAMIFSVMPFTYLLVGSLVTLIALRFVHGSATAIMGPVMSATISDLAPRDRRATWLSGYATVQGAGQAVAPVLAGMLIVRGRFDLAFITAGLAAAPVMAILASHPMFRLSSRPSRPRVPGHFAAGLLEVLGERRILIASVAHAFYFMINGTLNAFLPLFAADRIGLDAADIGALFGMQVVTTLAIRPAIGAASDRLGRRGAIAAGLLACAASVLGISIVTSSTGLTIAVVAYAAAVALTTAATSAYITDVAPRARFGAAHGVFGTIYDVGDATGPLVGGLLVQSWGYAPTFRLMAVLAAITAAAFAWLTRPPVRDSR
jgi:MFS family permease